MTDKTHLSNLSEISRYLCMNKYLKENLIEIESDNSFISLESLMGTEVVIVLGKDSSGVRKTGKTPMRSIFSSTRPYSQSALEAMRKAKSTTDKEEIVRSELKRFIANASTSMDHLRYSLHLAASYQLGGVTVPSNLIPALFTEIKERIDDLIKSDSVLSKMSHEEVLNYLHNETVVCFESKIISEVYVDDNGTEYIFEPPSIKCTLKESEQLVKHYFDTTPLIDPKENYYYP